MEYTRQDLEGLRDFYRSQLYDTIPFWFPRSFDHKFGGFLLMRDADGSLLYCWTILEEYLKSTFTQISMIQ